MCCATQTATAGRRSLTTSVVPTPLYPLSWHLCYVDEISWVSGVPPRDLQHTASTYCIFRIFFQIMKMLVADSGNLKYFDCGHLCSTGTCNCIQLERISHLCIRMRLSALHSPIPFLPIWQTVGKILLILSQLQRFSCYIRMCRCPHS